MDLKRKIMITLGLIVLYRLVSAVPAPGVQYDNVQTCVASAADSPLYSAISLLSGGTLFQLSLLALGVIPYITASIILQLLQAVVPRIKTLYDEGASGQAKITQYTRYLTIGLAGVQAGTLVVLASTPGRLMPGCDLPLMAEGTLAATTAVLALTAGALLLMRVGEIMTERGVGNGMSVLITVSILAGTPQLLASIYAAKGVWFLAAFVAILVVIFAVIAHIEQAQRRVPVVYTRENAPGRTGRTSSYLPLKLNPSGVLPIIFASSLLYSATIVASFFPDAGWAVWVERNFSVGDGLWMVAYITMIIGFSFFYIPFVADPVKLNRDIQTRGGFIPGFRPGSETVKYLAFLTNRLTAFGGLYLAAIAILPALFSSTSGVQQAFLGGTSILIVVTVGIQVFSQYSVYRESESLTGFLR